MSSTRKLYDARGPLLHTIPAVHFVNRSALMWLWSYSKFHVFLRILHSVSCLSSHLSFRVIFPRTVGVPPFPAVSERVDTSLVRGLGGDRSKWVRFRFPRVSVSVSVLGFSSQEKTRESSSRSRENIRNPWKSMEIGWIVELDVYKIRRFCLRFC